MLHKMKFYIDKKNKRRGCRGNSRGMFFCSNKERLLEYVGESESFKLTQCLIDIPWILVFRKNVSK